MRKGILNVHALSQRSQAMSPFTPGSYMGGMGGIPSMPDEVQEKLVWEEKTGERKGTIFKRDETKQLSVTGYRCTLCGFMELYAREK